MWASGLFETWVIVQQNSVFNPKIRIVLFSILARHNYSSQNLLIIVLALDASTLTFGAGIIFLILAHPVYKM